MALSEKVNPKINSNKNSSSLSKKKESNLPFFQPKLSIGAVNDAYEQEADAVAEKVMRKPKEEAPFFPSQAKPSVTRLSRKCSSCEEDIQKKEETETETSTHHSIPSTTIAGDAGVATPQNNNATSSGFFKANTIHPGIQRKCHACEEEDKKKVQPKRQVDYTIQRTCSECAIADADAAEKKEEETDPENFEVKVSPKLEDNASSSEASSDFEQGLFSSKNMGTPLDDNVRTDMESRFQQDFSRVRIHTHPESARLNSSIHAQAFTHEKDIYFNQGKYNPTTENGKKLLAHELTHVIQQTGSESVNTKKIQRSSEPKLGNWAHAQIQERLRSKDNDLITEAPIPGGTRSKKEINTVGFADFYKAQDHIVGGVRGKRPSDQVGLPDPKYVYENMPKKSATKLSPFSKIASGSTIKYGPRKSGKTWDTTTNFPSTFEVGELKPLFPFEFPSSLAYHGTGFLQTGNYVEGFQEFVARVNKDGAPTPPSISGSYMNIPDTNIPDAINYGKFATEQSNLKNPEGIFKKDTAQRVWMYRLKSGVYVYFLLPTDYKSDDFPTKIEKQLKALDPLLADLRKKHPTISSSINPKREAQPQRTKPSPKNSIQRKEDWAKNSKDWEEKRKNWVTGKVADVPKPKKFLKEDAAGVEKKRRIDKELGTSPDSKSKEGKEGKQVKQVRFWSSFRGRIFGALRFRFGKVFEKAEELFEKIRGKVKSRQLSADKLKSKNGIFSGWKKVATSKIIELAVEILKSMVAQAFSGFVSCINKIIEALTNKYTEDAKKELLEELQPLCCEIMVFKNSFEKKFDEYDSLIATFTETVEKIKKWREILSDVEFAIRAGVQIVSCGLPPGLGCLWGLVAQIGISSGLSLLMRTSYFEDEIAKPAASALMDGFVGDKFHNILVDVLEETPLASHMKDLQECQRRNTVIKYGKIGAGIGKLDPNDPAIVKARKEWENEFKDEMLKDLNDVFKGPKGKPLTAEEFQKLVEAIQKSGKTPEEMKELLEGSRSAQSGKLNFDDALSFAKGDKKPDKPGTKERKIDYDKATRSNEAYEKILGWSPFDFIKKPGVTSDSKEFADAVWDMQEAVGVEPDGIAGPETTIKFYDKNKLPKDALYRGAEKVKISEEEKKKTEEEMKKPYPSYTDLEKDLKALSWGLPKGEADFVTINGHFLVIIKSYEGYRLGAYFKYIEVDYKGTKRKKTIDTSDFINLDTIPEPDFGFAMPTLLKSEKPGETPIISMGLVKAAVLKEIPPLTHLNFREDFINIIL